MTPRMGEDYEHGPGAPVLGRQPAADPAVAVDLLPGQRPWVVVLLLGSLIALGPLSIDMYLPALPAITEDLSASPSVVQLTLTGMLAGLGLGQLLLGPLSDAYGRRRPLMAGIVLHVVTSLLCAIAPSIAVLGVFRVLQGVGVAAASVIAMAVVRDLYSGGAAAAILSRLLLVMGVAPVLAPSIGGLVLEVGTWRTVFVALAVAGLLLLAVAGFGLRETLPPERRAPAGLRPTLRGYADLLHDRTLVLLMLVGGLTLAAVFAYVAAAPFVLQVGHGLDERTFALVFGAGAIFLILASQANVMLLRRYAPGTILQAALLAGALAGAALVVTSVTGLGGLLGVLAPLWVVLAVIALCGPNAGAIAMTRHGERAGAAAALLGASQFVIGAAAAPLTGLGSEGSAVPMALTIAGTLVLAAVLARLAIRGSAD